jgi:hypothetical protein
VAPVGLEEHRIVEHGVHGLELGGHPEGYVGLD